MVFLRVGALATCFLLGFTISRAYADDSFQYLIKPSPTIEATPEPAQRPATRFKFMTPADSSDSANGPDTPQSQAPENPSGSTLKFRPQAPPSPTIEATPEPSPQPSEKVLKFQPQALPAQVAAPAPSQQPTTSFKLTTPAATETPAPPGLEDEAESPEGTVKLDTGASSEGMVPENVLKDDEETPPGPESNPNATTFQLTQPQPSPSPSEIQNAEQKPPQTPGAADAIKFKNTQKASAPEPDLDYEERPTQPAREVILDYSYPHVAKFLTYRPGYFSISQTLVQGSAVTPTFNYSAYAPAAVSFGALLDVDSQWTIDSTISIALFHASANQLAFFNLNSSTTTIVTAVVAPYYCFHPGGTLLKICPGAGIGVDSYPILQFDTTTDISLHSYADMILRGGLKLEYPISRASTLVVSAGYDKGMLNTDTIGVTTTEHETLWGWLGVDNVLSPKMHYFVNFRTERKITDFSQAPDAWEATSTLYTLGLGIGF